MESDGCGQADEGDGGPRVEGNVERNVIVVGSEDLTGNWGDTVEGWVVFKVRCQDGIEEGRKRMVA